MLTVGFSTVKGLFDWHNHLPGNESLDENIKNASEWINNVVNDKKGIVCSSILGYYPGDPGDLEDGRKNQQKGEIIDLKYWRDF